MSIKSIGIVDTDTAMAKINQADMQNVGEHVEQLEPCYTESHCWACDRMNTWQN